MCERCPELQERIDYLESELGLRQEAHRLVTLHDRLNLTRGEAGLVLALYEAKRRVCSRHLLDELVPGERDDFSSLNTFAVAIHRVRKKVGRDFIETVWGRGFRLSVAAQARLADLFGESVEAAA